MTPLDDQLDRLLRTAAGREDAVAAVPLGLETRILAAWRGRLAPASGLWNTALLVRGLLLASLITILCLWPALSHKASSGPDATALQLADSTLQVDRL